MSINLPPALKSLTKLLQQSKKLEKIDPLMSYFIKTWAVQKGVDLNNQNQSNENKQALMQLLDQLDNESQALKERLKEVEGKDYVTSFAFKAFIHADDEDKQGKTSKKTALTFLSAALFLETIKQFGELDENVEERLKYARWRSVVINTALKNGETPPPPPNNDGVDLESELENYPLEGNIETESTFNNNNSGGNGGNEKFITSGPQVPFSYNPPSQSNSNDMFPSVPSNRPNLNQNTNSITNDLFPSVPSNKPNLNQNINSNTNDMFPSVPSNRPNISSQHNQSPPSYTNTNITSNEFVNLFPSIPNSTPSPTTQNTFSPNNNVNTNSNDMFPSVPSNRPNITQNTTSNPNDLFPSVPTNRPNLTQNNNSPNTTNQSNVNDMFPSTPTNKPNITQNSTSNPNDLFPSIPTNRPNVTQNTTNSNNNNVNNNFPSVPTNKPNVTNNTTTTPSHSTQENKPTNSTNVSSTTTTSVSVSNISFTRKVHLEPEEISEAQKFAKWGYSALNFDDVDTAILNLKKSLAILTGQKFN